MNVVNVANAHVAAKIGNHAPWFAEKFQRAGLGTSIVKDIQDDIFELGYKSIEISIDEENIGSLRLFEKAGFAFVSKEAELLNFVYKKE